MTREELINAIFQVEKVDVGKDGRTYTEEELYESISKMDDEKLRLYYDLFIREE